MLLDQTLVAQAELLLAAAAAKALLEGSLAGNQDTTSTLDITTKLILEAYGLDGRWVAGRVCVFVYAVGETGRASWG